MLMRGIYGPQRGVSSILLPLHRCPAEAVEKVPFVAHRLIFRSLNTAGTTSENDFMGILER